MREISVDLFAGGGGVSEGYKIATGRKHLATFAIAVIKQIMSDNTTAEVKEVEINQTLKDLDAAYGDESLPWDLTNTKKPSAPTESPKENYQSKCTINVTKVESFLDPWYLEQILKEKRGMVNERN